MAGWRIVSTGALTLGRTNRLADMYVLSPFVWREGERYRILVRAVPRRDDDPRLKMSEIWHGVSYDGAHFDMDVAPTIFTGPDLVDLDGCEDPTVRVDADAVRVWYTGYNHRQQTGRLLLARGPSVERICKAGLSIDSTPAFENPKESSVVRIADGRWRMFFEYAAQGASRIGQADAAGPDGPWGDLKPSVIEPRPDRWDGWHLSAGPVIREGSAHPTMFYNGADGEARWRIGWLTFDKALSKVVARCEEALIDPPKPRVSGSDMAFAASAVEVEPRQVRLYYSVSDQDLRHALLEEC